MPLGWSDIGGDRVGVVGFWRGLGGSDWWSNFRGEGWWWRSVVELLHYSWCIHGDFAFFDPKPDDFHGVKMLLYSYLDDKVWDLSGFVDLILAQTIVDSVVKIEDDEDEGLFILLIDLNLGRYKRVMNLPPQLLPHLYNALFDEISWATEDELTKDLHESFRFKHCLLVTRIYKKIGQKRKESSSSNDEDFIYVKPEDEIFFELKNYRLMELAMAVEADKAPAFREKLQSLIEDS
uniref:Uncharacterized protein n=1 Tax=Chenopodium quinoa TaxID=63459 RepID=A0A803LJS1_CHEQI